MAYTKPGLRERLKNQIMSGSKGGKPGRNLAQRALDPPHAGGAGHAADAEIDLAGGGCSDMG